MARAVLALDPGLTTGWAALYNPGADDEMFASGEVRGALALVDSVLRLFGTGWEWEVVIERYIITPNTLTKTRQYEPLEIIGAVRWLCHDRDRPFAMQSPAEAKAFSTDTKLKRVGWYRRGLGHANDAARHLLLYTATHRLIDLERLA